MKETENGNSESYIGLTSRTFKDRYTKHRSSINNENSKQKTTLRKHIWNLKGRKINFELTWKILQDLAKMYFSHKADISERK